MRRFKQRWPTDPAQGNEADVDSAGAASSSSRSGPAATVARRLKSISPELSSEMPSATAPKRARSTFESGLREIAALTGVAFSAFEQPPASDRRRRKSVGRTAAVSPELVSPPTRPVEASAQESEATRLDRPKKKKRAGLASSYRREADALSRDCYSAAHDPKSASRGRTRLRTSFPESPVKSATAHDSPAFDATADRPQDTTQQSDEADSLAYAIVARASQLERQEYRRAKRELKELEHPYFAASRVPVAGSSRSGKRRTTVSESLAVQEGVNAPEAGAIVADTVTSQDTPAENVSASSDTTPSVASGAEVALPADVSTDASPGAPTTTSSEPASNLRIAAKRSRTVPSSHSETADIDTSTRTKEQRRVRERSAGPSGTARDEASQIAASASDPAGVKADTTMASTAEDGLARVEGLIDLALPGPASSSPVDLDGQRPGTANELGVCTSTDSISGLSKRQRRPPTRFDDEVDAAVAERKRGRPAHNNESNGATKSKDLSLAEQKTALKAMKIQKLPGAKARNRSKSATNVGRPSTTIIPAAAFPADPATASATGSEVATDAVEANLSTGSSQPEAIPTTKGCTISPMSYEQLTLHLPPEQRPDVPGPAVAPVSDAFATTSPSPKKRRVTKKPVSPSAVDPKQPKPRARHPALDSKEAWVTPERDVRMTREGRPPIWCEGRQELCESLDYFKSYQGGHCEL